jgi:hypothetical protein
MSFLAESGEVVTETVDTPGALSRTVNVTQAQLMSVAERNPWAATALLAIQSTGAKAELKAGHMVLERLPTAENFASFAAGVAKAPALPEGIRARVSYRLDRGPGEMAILTISSYTVDADERMIYKVYPDVVAEFIESGPVGQNASTTLVSRQEDKGQDARTLTMTRWHSVQ